MLKLLRNGRKKPFVAVAGYSLKQSRSAIRTRFFDVESINDVIEVWLNDQHPVHEHLIDVVASETEDNSPEELIRRLTKAAFTLRLLLVAWARHEDKAPSGVKDVTRGCQNGLGTRSTQIPERYRIVNKPGEDVIALLERASSSVLIVAPFIRSEALSLLLDSISSGVETIIVTRWRPADLVSGASDLGVFEIAESRDIPLYLRHDLHAKFFASDDKCLVGSANVTQTALGWRTPANLELLTPVERTSSHIVQFEKELLTFVVRATLVQRDYLKDLVETLQSVAAMMPITGVEETTMGLLPSSWVPQSRNPEELYSVYCGNRDVSRSVLQTMHQEIREIGAIPGMDKDGFKAWVAATISQTPIIDRVIQQIEEKGHVTEGALREVLTEVGVDTGMYRARDVLEVLRRWLTYFLPEKYETAQDSVKLIKAKNI